MLVKNFEKISFYDSKLHWCFDKIIEKKTIKLDTVENRYKHWRFERKSFTLTKNYQRHYSYSLFEQLKLCTQISILLWRRAFEVSFNFPLRRWLNFSAQKQFKKKRAIQIWFSKFQKIFNDPSNGRMYPHLLERPNCLLDHLVYIREDNYFIFSRATSYSSVSCFRSFSTSGKIVHLYSLEQPPSLPLHVFDHLVHRGS